MTIATKVLPIPWSIIPSRRCPDPGKEASLLSNSTLQCRQQKLFVSVASSAPSAHQWHSLDDTDWFGSLHRASIRAICLDPELGETQLRAWAQLGDGLCIPTFLRLPSTPHLPHKHRPRSWAMKRALDWGVAALLLLLVSPILLVLMVLMQLNSPGPVFFQQWRVGDRGKLFRIIKFRTMTVGAEALHHQVMAKQSGLHKLEDDPRVTPFGRWMRRCSLDELPQLINVLRGEMSLVGPRPWALYDALQIDLQGQKRLNALPGLTGAWQVSARSNLRNVAEVNALDLDYLRHWSFGLDLKILLRTIPKVITGTGAY